MHWCKQKDVLGDKEGTTIVLNGDAPLITKETLQGLIQYHNEHQMKGTVMTCDCDLNKKFGRIIRENDQVKGIVEYKDCTDEQEIFLKWMLENIALIMLLYLKH